MEKKNWDELLNSERPPEGQAEKPRDNQRDNNSGGKIKKTKTTFFSEIELLRLIRSWILMHKRAEYADESSFEYEFWHKLKLLEKRIKLQLVEKKRGKK